jgi:hypothetical protein
VGLAAVLSGSSFFMIIFLALFLFLTAVLSARHDRPRDE